MDKTPNWFSRAPVAGKRYWISLAKYRHPKNIQGSPKERGAIRERERKRLKRRYFKKEKSRFNKGGEKACLKLFPPFCGIVRRGGLNFKGRDKF
jgi:hypothetical protein